MINENYWTGRIDILRNLYVVSIEMIEASLREMLTLGLSSSSIDFLKFLETHKMHLFEL